MSMKPAICGESADDRRDASLHEYPPVMLATSHRINAPAAVTSSSPPSSFASQVPATASIRVVYIDSPKIVTTDVANFRNIVQQLTGKPSSPKSSALHDDNHISNVANPSKGQQEEEYGQSGHVIAGATNVILKNNISIQHNGHLHIMKEIAESTSSSGQGKDYLMSSAKVFPKSKSLIPRFENDPPLATQGIAPMCTSPMQQENHTLCSNQHEFEALFLPTLNIKPPPILSNPGICGKSQLENFLSNNLSCFSNLSSTYKDFPNGIDAHSFSEQDILAGLVSDEQPLPDLTMLPPLVEEKLDLIHDNHANDQNYPDTKMLPHWNSLQL